MPNAFDLAVQVFFGILVFGGSLWFGYVRWLRPHSAWLDAKGKGTLFLLLVALFGGGIGAFGWFADDPRSFSWDLPPLASRMLAAAGWAFAVPSFLAIRRPTWPRVAGADGISHADRARCCHISSRSL